MKDPELVIEFGKRLYDSIPGASKDFAARSGWLTRFSLNVSILVDKELDTSRSRQTGFGWQFLKENGDCVGLGGSLNRNDRSITLARSSDESLSKFFQRTSYFCDQLNEFEVIKILNLKEIL